MSPDPAADDSGTLEQAAASFGVPVPPAESAVADALRLAFHSSDTLRWSDGWMHYASGQWRRDETAGVGIAMRLSHWINAEAAALARAGVAGDMVERRQAWANTAGTRQRIEDALFLARSLLSASARPADEDEWPIVATPSAREQVLAAAVHALAAANTEHLRAQDTRRIVATRLAAAVRTSKLWHAMGPPMGSDDLERLLSAAVGGRKFKRRSLPKGRAAPPVPVHAVAHLSPT